MPEDIKLTYFNARGRAEIIRLVLKANNMDFEDCRIEKEQWPEIKPTIPTGQLPVVDYDGKKLTQSMAIARAIAKKHGMMGDDDKEYYMVERAIGQITDVLEGMYKLYFYTGDKKEEMKKEYVEVTGKNHLKVLEGFLKDDLKFFANNKVTLADLCLIQMSDYLMSQYADLFAQFPKLKELRERVIAENKGVADWLQSRPVTEM